jgi:hypothetical protein
LAKQTFSFGEVVDVLLVREAIVESSRRDHIAYGAKKGSGQGHKAYRYRRSDHSRSRSRNIGRRQQKASMGRHTGHRQSKGNNRPHAPEQETGPPPVLWTAAMEGNLDTCRHLLQDSSIDVDETYKSWTPLMKASEEGNVEIVELLLDNGADIKATNLKGRDSLSFAAAPSMKRVSTPRHFYVLRLLVERGADPLRQDDRGLTAKDRAKEEGRDDIVKCLEDLEYGLL